MRRVAVMLGVLLALAGCGASAGPAPVVSAADTPTSVATSTPPSAMPPAAHGGADGAPNEVDVAPDDAGVTTWPTATVTRVVDGDTLDVTGFGRVRVKGIDAPEIGECGHDEATAELSRLVLGRQVSLVPSGRDNRDRYGRLLRYVLVDATDAGRDLIGAGLAVARYDSRDGYGAHPRESDYVALDAQVPNKGCPPVPVDPAPAPSVAPSPKKAAPSADAWNQPGPDLDCSDIRHKVRITGPDYHRLDADGDGWGCESYG